MEETLHSLNKLDDSDKLRSYVQNLSIEVLSFEVRKVCLKEDGHTTLQILFKGLSNSATCREKRAKIAAAVLNSIEKGTISQRLTHNLIGVLATEADNLETSHLVALINSCLQMMHINQEYEGNFCWKDIIPQMLTAAMVKSDIEHNGIKMTGLEFKSQIVSAIIQHDWNDNMIGNIASMFIDIPLSSEEHIKVVNKLCRSFKNVKLHEIPPLTHQLLQLTKEQNSMQIFMTLAEFFDTNLYKKLKFDTGCVDSQIPGKNGTNLKEIQMVEGTVLYHVNRAASILSPKSVKNFIKALKECNYHPQFVLQPFFLTLLLNLSRVSSAFEEEILNLLTSVIMKAIAQDVKIFNSAWFKLIVLGNVNVEDIIKNVMENCCSDRDGVLEGLIGLGFSLMILKGPKSKENQSELAWKIGTTLLVNLVEKFAHVTSSVFHNLVNQITQNYDSSRYTDCLYKVARKRPLNLLDCSTLLIQLMANICLKLPSDSARRVLAAILPLTKMKPLIRDNMIIVLRKALMSDQSSKEMAVYGFLELLKDFQITDVRCLSQSVSQNYVGITQIYSETLDSTTNAVSNEGMCLEILMILKQVFEYHHQVKVLLYKGFYDSFYANPKLGVHIIDNLKGRLDNFYKGPKEIPPLDFNKTIAPKGSSVEIKEPIGYLLLAIALIISKTEDSDAGKQKFNSMLYSMCEAMADSDISHFGLNKEDFQHMLEDNLENQLNQEKVRQILSVYEALMGYVLCTWEKNSLESARVLFSLFKSYSKLSEYAKSAGKALRKKPNRKTREEDEFNELNVKKETSKLPSFKFSSTTLNLKCACRLLVVLTGMSVNWTTAKSIELLKGKREFHRYAYNVILELLKESSDSSYSELVRSKYKLQHIFYAGRILYTQCLLRLSEVKEFDLQCAVMSMECFQELLNFAHSHLKHKTSKFFAEIGLPNEDAEIQIKIILDSVFKHMVDLLEIAEEEGSKDDVQPRKLCLLLISISSFLIRILPTEGIHIQQVYDQVRLFCKEKKVQNPTIAKMLLSLLLHVQSKVKPSGTLLPNLVLCLCDCMALIDDEMDIEVHEKFAIINSKTENSCLTAICDALHLSISEIEWALSRYKAELSIVMYLSEESRQRYDVLLEKEREICRRLNFTIKVLSMICTIAIPPGTLADIVMKEISNLYSKLTMATKYFYYKFTKHHQTFLSAKFEKTIRIADHELTKNMYCFTEHIIADGSASTDAPPLKKYKADATALKNKVLKETKYIPKVIYEKEEFQKCVLQLSNKTKIDLPIKNMMARDYRLYAKQVKEAIQNDKIYEEEISMKADDTSKTSPSGSSQKSKISRIE